MRSQHQEIVGFLDPAGQAPGFLVPLFGKPGAFLVQEVEPDGVVRRFAPYSPKEGEAVVLDACHVAAAKSGPYMCAFRFSDSDIVAGAEAVVKGVLETRLQEIAPFPFVRMDVLSFLKRWDEAETAAKQIAETTLANAESMVRTKWLGMQLGAIQDKKKLAEAGVFFYLSPGLSATAGAS